MPGGGEVRRVPSRLYWVSYSRQKTQGLTRTGRQTNVYDMDKQIPEIGEKYAARFRSRIVVGGDDECWPWRGRGKGRPEFRVTSSEKLNAAPVALILDGQPKPFEGARALHSCDNDRCMNPRHLRWGTQRENIEDKVKRRRCACGERAAKSKLKEGDVREIRASEETGIVLGRRYGVTPKSIYEIKRGHTWRHVE